jgi:hypothetical protein
VHADKLAGIRPPLFGRCALSYLVVFGVLVDVVVVVWWW